MFFRSDYAMAMKQCALAASLGAILLASQGCASKADRDKVFSAWIGHDINRLIVILGPTPAQYTLPNGNQVYTWVETFPSDCTMTFTANRSGIIVDWFYQGKC